MHRTLVLGGVRSGKSAYAEKLAIASLRPKLYVATAIHEDAEMSERIKAHQVRRGTDWQMLEEPINVAAILRDQRWSDYIILVDCLTLWISNLLVDPTQNIPQRCEELCAAVCVSKAEIVFVTNEVGLGGIPMHRVSRQFADHAGRLHQQLAEICDTVTLVVAGLPLLLKAAKP